MSLSLIITIMKKHQLLKMWTKLKFTNLPGKVRSKIVKEANQRMKSIFQIYLQTKVCKLSAVNRDQHWTSLLSFTPQYGWSFPTMKSIKKYCHDDRKGVKVGACTNNLNWTVNYSKLMYINVTAKCSPTTFSYLSSPIPHKCLLSWKLWTNGLVTEHCKTYSKVSDL